MAENKKSFLLYCDLIHTVRKMPDDKAGELFKHILRYVNDENPTTNDIIIDLTFEPIKQQLKRDLIKYESIRERNSANGAKGGRPKKPKKPTGLFGNPDKPKKADSVNDSVNDINKHIPTFKDFQSYAVSKEPRINKRDLKFKYESWVENGWKNGNGRKIKNWKTSLLNTIPHMQTEKAKLI